MSSALSIDLRQRVVHAVEAGASRHQAAERFGVGLASAGRWCGQFGLAPEKWRALSVKEEVSDGRT
ncbi:MAG: hypothetical protein NVSMB62_29000 [Acidobacteriaceae bacterium]